MKTEALPYSLRFHMAWPFPAQPLLLGHEPLAWLELARLPLSQGKPSLAGSFLSSPFGFVHAQISAQTSLPVTTLIRSSPPQKKTPWHQTFMASLLSFVILEIRYLFAFLTKFFSSFPVPRTELGKSRHARTQNTVS